MKYLLPAAVLLCGLLQQPASAQTQTPAPAQVPAPVNNSAKPIEITATKTVEWLRDQKQYIARENVIVTQGAMTLKSDLLTADYREGAASSMEIWQLTAAGSVQISDLDNTAYGDNAVYDVTKGVATLTGNNLRLVSPDQTVTAQDRMEYHSNERKALAIGKAKVVRLKDTLSADTLVAYFADGNAAAPAAKKPGSDTLPGTGGNLDRLEAIGNVVIKTPTETLYGNKAIYTASTNTAGLTGKVRIERDQNILEGDRAEVNLNTNISKLFGSEKEGSRVRGVFFPGTEKKETSKAPDKKAPTVIAPVPAPATAPVVTPKPAQVTKPAPVAVIQPTLTVGAPDISPAETPTAPPQRPAKVSPRIEY